MSDTLSYADRARKAISPSNLAVKALSIVAHHSNPQTIDDWPQVGSQRKADSSKKPSPDQHAAKSNSLAFIVSKSISSSARLQPSHPQNKSSSAPVLDLPTANQKVIFGSIGLETPPPLSPTPAPVPPELSTKIPTSFSVGLDNSTESVPARLKSRTRPSAEEPEPSKTNDAATPSSATTQPPNKWKFGTTTTTPVVNGKKPLPPDDSSEGNPSSSLLFQQPDTDSNRPKRRERAISFGYIDSLLPLDENVSAPTKTKSKSKNKTKSKVIPKTKPTSSPQVEVTNQIDDVDPNPHSNPIPNSNREDRDADSDPDFKVRDFGFGFGSGAVRCPQGGDEGQANDEPGDKQSVALTTGGQTQQSPQPSAGPVIIDSIPPPITPPHQHGPPPQSQPHGHLSRSSRRANTFGNVSRAGGYGSHIHSHERGGYGPGYERGGRGGMNGYSRGYPSGRGYNRGGGGGGGGPASSHSSPSGGGGQRIPYDNVTSPSLPPLPLHFSQLPHQSHGMDPMYYPPPRHISGAGPPGPFDPYQPYPHLHQHSHLPPLPPHLQGYPQFQQVPPPLPPHLLASSVSSSASISNASSSAAGSPAAGRGDGVPPSISTTSSTSTSSSTSPLPRNASSSSSTSPRSSSTPPSSHSSPPVPMPLTILPFPLDSIRYYLLGQLEYYLSPQNMVQDFFLRTQMDSKGYIPISLLASFNRIKQLTLDTRLVKEVLLLSAFVEVNGGMVRMGGVGGKSGGGGGGNESQSSWESFVLPDAAESIVVEDVVENVVVDNSNNGGYGGYHQHQQLNGYGYGGAGYGYGYGAAGYGYGYGYGYPPPVGPAGLGYYEDPQSQQHLQQHAGYEQGEGVDDSSSHDHGETVPPSMLMNGHTTAGGICESTTTTTRKLDDDRHHTVPPPTSVLLSKEKEEDNNNKLNGIFKHDQQHGNGDEGEEYEDGEEEEEEEEEDVVFVMGTDVSTSWTTPERERRA